MKARVMFPTTTTVRLVVLAPKFTHSTGDDKSKAIQMAEKVLAKRDAGLPILRVRIARCL